MALTEDGALWSGYLSGLGRTNCWRDISSGDKADCPLFDPAGWLAAIRISAEIGSGFTFPAKSSDHACPAESAAPSVGNKVK